MQELITAVEQKYRKKSVPAIKSGDTVRVSQRIDEGGKTRAQIFEGLVIRTRRSNSISNSVTVRRVASGVGVEKTFMLHHPSIEKIEIIRRSKVRRNYLTYMRKRTGKSARLNAVTFDREAVNAENETEPDSKDAKSDESQASNKDDNKQPAKESKTDDKSAKAESDTKADKSDKKDEAASKDSK